MFGFGGPGPAMPFIMFFGFFRVIIVLLFLYFTWSIAKSLRRIADKLDKQDS